MEFAAVPPVDFWYLRIVIASASDAIQRRQPFSFVVQALSRDP